MKTEIETDPRKLLLALVGDWVAGWIQKGDWTCGYCGYAPDAHEFDCPVKRAQEYLDATEWEEVT